jgi:hypothetical protein
VFGHDQYGATPLTTECEALDQSQHGQQDRSERTDLCVRRQQADGERGDTHHQQRQHQQLLAAQPVAEVAEHHSTDRTGEEAHCEGGEAQEGPCQLFTLREEELAEHHRRGDAVEEEVVPLDRRTDETRADHADDRCPGPDRFCCCHGGLS